MQNPRIENAQLIKRELSQIKGLKTVLIKSLTEIEFSEINLIKTSTDQYNSYEIIFPNRIYNEFEKLKSFLKTPSKKTDLYFYEIYGSDNEKYDELNINIQIYFNDYNRIHISGNGLSLTFKKLGLGKKIYKRMMAEVEYISSTYQDSMGIIQNSIESDLLWNSILQDNSIISQTDGNKFIATLNSTNDMKMVFKYYFSS